MRPVPVTMDNAAGERERIDGGEGRGVLSSASGAEECCCMPRVPRSAALCHECRGVPLNALFGD